jgi:hypothetical protein
MSEELMSEELMSEVLIRRRKKVIILCQELKRKE